MSQATDLEAQVATQPDDVSSPAKIQLPSPPTKKPAVPSTLDKAMALAEEQEWQTVEEFMRLMEAMNSLQRDMAYISKCRLAPPNGSSSFFVEDPPDDTIVEQPKNVLDMVTRFAQSHLSLSRAESVLDGIDLAYIDERQAKLYFAKLAYMCKVLAQSIQRMIVVIGSKGGAGKTSLIALLSVVYAYVTEVATVLVEGNENGGTLNLRVAVSRSRVKTKLADAVKDPSLVNTHKKSGKSNLGTHWQSGLHVLLADANNTKNQFLLQSALKLLNVLDDQYYAVFGDTGNGMGYTKTANTAILLKGHVALLPAVCRDYQTYNELLNTMINMFNEGHLDMLHEFSRVVLNGVKEDDTIEQFMEKIFEIAVEMTTDEGEATVNSNWKNNPVRFLRDVGFVYDEETEKFTGEKIFTVPFSQWIADGKAISVLPEDIGQDTLTAALEILLECLTMDVQTDEEMQREIDRLIDMEKAAEAEKVKKIMKEEGIDPDHYKSRRDMRATGSESVIETPMDRFQEMWSEALKLVGGDPDKVLSVISQLATGIPPEEIHR